MLQTIKNQNHKTTKAKRFFKKMKSKAEEYKVAIAKIFAEKDALTSKKD